MSLEHSPDSGNTPQDGSAKPAQTVLDPMLRVPEVLIEMGWKSRTTLYTKVRDGDFPPPTETGPNAIRWPLSVVRAHRASLPQRTYANEAAA